MVKPNVVLIDAQTRRRGLLSKALHEFSYPVIGQYEKVQQLVVSNNQPNYDVIVAGIDLPDSEILQRFALLNQRKPTAVVMFAEKDTPQIIHAAVKAGISAYIVDDIQARRLPSIINVAMARFNEQQSLKTELEQTKTKLAQRKVLDKAKGLLMVKKNISEDSAYGLIRKLAMDKGLTLAAASENIIDVFAVME